MIDEPIPEVAPRNRKGVGERRDVAEILNEDGDRIMRWCLAYKVSKQALAMAMKTGMSHEDIVQSVKLRLLKLKTVLAHYKQSTVICSAVRWTVYRICENSRQKRKLPSLEFIGRGDFGLIDSHEQSATEHNCLAHQAILETIAKLHSRDQRVITMRYGLDGKPEMTLAEVAKALGVTRQRVEQIQSKAMARLRHPALIGRLEALAGE